MVHIAFELIIYFYRYEKNNAIGCKEKDVAEFNFELHLLQMPLSLVITCVTSLSSSPSSPRPLTSFLHPFYFMYIFCFIFSTQDEHSTVEDFGKFKI